MSVSVMERSTVSESSIYRIIHFKSPRALPSVPLKAAASRLQHLGRDGALALGMYLSLEWNRAGRRVSVSLSPPRQQHPRGLCMPCVPCQGGCKGHQLTFQVVDLLIWRGRGLWGGGRGQGGDISRWWEPWRVGPCAPPMCRVFPGGHCRCQPLGRLRALLD